MGGLKINFTTRCENGHEKLISSNLVWLATGFKKINKNFESCGLKQKIRILVVLNIPCAILKLKS